MASANPDALVYECTARKLLEVDAAGDQKESDVLNRVYMREPPTLLFITTDGTARWFGNLWRYRTIQQPTHENDLVAVREFRGQARAGIDVVRIRAWTNPITFLLNDGMKTFSGTCIAR
jgi:hypothetical protein